MARIRTIKPEFWTHEDLSELPEATHMLAAALLNYADDEGYFNANPGLVKAACCPLREPSVSVQDSLDLLSKIGFVRLGSADDGKRYGWIVTFDDHQRVNRPSPSKIKALGIVFDSSPTAHTQISEGSPPERNREQGKEQGMEVEPSASPQASSSASPTDLLGSPPPVNISTAKAERLAQITDDAIAAFNSSPLVKPNGGRLATVNPKVGREKRQAQVKRCLRTARAICQEDYQSDRITSEFWRDYCLAVHEDDFHSGRQAGGRGHENWVPDFEFLTREATMLKVYDRAASGVAA